MEKYNQYHNQCHYENSTWINDTSPNYKADNGMSCLITVIIVLSLTLAALWYIGLF